MMSIIAHDNQLDYPVTVIGETQASYRVIAIQEMSWPSLCRPGDIVLVPKHAVRIEFERKTGKEITTPPKIVPPPQISFLYTPPASSLAEAAEQVNQWHAKMTSKYIATDRSVFQTLFTWLERARVPLAEMLAYGVFPSVSRYQCGILAHEFHKEILDHGRVLQRRGRRRGSYLVLGEPFGTMEKIEKSSYVTAWRALGARVTCFSESGWIPGNTITVMIEAPVRK